MPIARWTCSTCCKSNGGFDPENIKTQKELLDNLPTIRKDKFVAHRVLVNYPEKIENLILNGFIEESLDIITSGMEVGIGRKGDSNMVALLGWLEPNDVVGWIARSTSAESSVRRGSIMSLWANYRHLLPPDVGDAVAGHLYASMGSEFIEKWEEKVNRLSLDLEGARLWSIRECAGEQQKPRHQRRRNPIGLLRGKAATGGADHMGENINPKWPRKKKILRCHEMLMGNSSDRDALWANSVCKFLDIKRTTGRPGNLPNNAQIALLDILYFQRANETADKDVWENRIDTMISRASDYALFYFATRHATAEVRADMTARMARCETNRENIETASLAIKMTHPELLHKDQSIEDILSQVSQDDVDRAFRFHLPGFLAPSFSAKPHGERNYSLQTMLGFIKYGGNDSALYAIHHASSIDPKGVLESALTRGERIATSLAMVRNHKFIEQEGMVDQLRVLDEVAANAYDNAQAGTLFMPDPGSSVLWKLADYREITKIENDMERKSARINKIASLGREKTAQMMLELTGFTSHGLKRAMEQAEKDLVPDDEMIHATPAPS